MLRQLKRFKDLAFSSSRSEQSRLVIFHPQHASYTRWRHLIWRVSCQWWNDQNWCAVTAAYRHRSRQSNQCPAFTHHAMERLSSALHAGQQSQESEALAPWHGKVALSLVESMSVYCTHDASMPWPGTICHLLTRIASTASTHTANLGKPFNQHNSGKPPCQPRVGPGHNMPKQNVPVPVAIQPSCAFSVPQLPNQNHTQ
jgi:hypothetical protein